MLQIQIYILKGGLSLEQGKGPVQILLVREGIRQRDAQFVPGFIHPGHRRLDAPRRDSLALSSQGV